MAGGCGTRLWPLSRTAKPKQFQKLITDKTLISETYDRIAKVVPNEQIYVATVEQYRDNIQKELPNILPENILFEPMCKNSGPAFAFISAILFKRNKSAIVATVPSDHLINNVEAFASVFKAADEQITQSEGKLLAISIRPDHPNTGLGYLKIGKVVNEIDGYKVFEIEEFKEKPDLETAEMYVKNWQYLWNSACYFWHAKDMLEWLEKVRPNVVAAAKKIATIYDDPSKTKEIKEIYGALDNEQIEYALVEQMKGVLTIPADLGWSDIGNWDTIQDILMEKYDAKIISKGAHVDEGSENLMVYSNDRMIATVGLKDLIVIDSDDALLIIDRKHTQDIKKLLAKLKDSGKHSYL